MKGRHREPHKDSIHLDLAADVVREALVGKYESKRDLDEYRMRSNAIAEDEKKALCQMLGKLYLPDEADDDKVRTLKLLVTSLRTVSVASSSIVSSAQSRLIKQHISVARHGTRLRRTR